MTTSRTQSSALTALLTVCVLLAGLGLVARIVQLASPRTSDREAQARMAEGLKSLEVYRSFRNDPFNRMKLPAVPTITPQMKEAFAGSRAVVEAFMKEVRADNLTAAYRMTSASFRERVGQEDFEILICNHPELKHPERCLVFGNVRLPNGSGSQQIGPPATSATTTVNITVGVRGTIDDIQIAERMK